MWRSWLDLLVNMYSDGGGPVERGMATLAGGRVLGICFHPTRFS